jgi:hypothetical protein
MKLNYDISHFLKHKITLGRVAKIASSYFFFQVAGFNTTIIVTRKKSLRMKKVISARVMTEFFVSTFILLVHFASFVT